MMTKGNAYTFNEHSAFAVSVLIHGLVVTG